MELSCLIEALSKPGAYPHPVGEVEVRQTHISAVFLAGPYAYKVKKPVNPGFLDFSTPEKRRHYCEEEVRLNRRTAPQVYLGVVPVIRSPGGIHFEGEGEIIDWAVKMQRLPDSATLQDRLRRGPVSVELAEALARRIASFHQGAEANERMAAFGRYEAVAGVVLDLFAQAAPQVGTTVSPAVFSKVKALAEQALTRLRPLIERRADRGMTRDCHGDLHLDHIYHFPGQPPTADLVMIDCIEFNERFRFTDPVADMAFPAMEFAFFGRRDLSRAFAAAYFDATGDEDGRGLLPLYTAYRAVVRGLVEGILLGEKEVPQGERTAALTRSRAHWLLALGELAEPGRRPCLLLVAGLPGTGKSTLARGLAGRAGFHVVRSDVVRKQLARRACQGPTPTPVQDGPYTADWIERTYAECLRQAERLLFEGKRVLVDATFREERHREAFLDAALRWGVPGGMLLCQAEPDAARRRLSERQNDPSEADWSVHLHFAESWEAIGPAARRALRTVSTEGSPAQPLPRAVEALRHFGLWDESEHDDMKAITPSRRDRAQT
jgi:aminoglycoside phosphotransferase family enzyme/predicted kinase